MSGDCGHGWGYEGPNGCERCNEYEAREKALIENSPQMDALRAELAATKAREARLRAFAIGLDQWDRKVAAAFAPALPDHMRQRLDEALAEKPEGSGT